MNEFTAQRCSATHGITRFSTIPAIVNKIADGLVHVYRPYATTADFSYTGGVIPYIGIEQFTLSQQYDTRKVTVVQRKELK